jgi:hypothetical protein
VAVLNWLTNTDQNILISRYDIYSQKIVNSAIWRPNQHFHHIHEMFPKLPMRGYKFRISNEPYDYFVNADLAPEPIVDQKRMYINRRGYEIDMLNAAAEVMNFNYDITNPEDHSFGSVVNGTWNGQIGQVANGHVDFIIGVFVITLDRLKVSPKKIRIVFKFVNKFVL